MPAGVGPYLPCADRSLRSQRLSRFSDPIGSVEPLVCIPNCFNGAVLAGTFARVGSDVCLRKLFVRSRVDSVFQFCFCSWLPGLLRSLMRRTRVFRCSARVLLANAHVACRLTLRDANLRKPPADVGTHSLANTVRFQDLSEAYVPILV